MNTSNKLSWLTCVVGVLCYGGLVLRTDGMRALMEGEFKYYLRGGSLYTGQVVVMLPLWLLVTAVVQPPECTVVERAALFLIWATEGLIVVSLWWWPFWFLWVLSLAALTCAFYLMMGRPDNVNNNAHTTTAAATFCVCSFFTIAGPLLALWKAVL